MRNFFIFLLFNLSIFPLLCYFHIGDNLKVMSVVDGDTIHFEKNIKCRLAYIDTPEISKNDKFNKDYIKCSDITENEMLNSGANSSRYLKSLIKKGDLLHVKIVDTDRYKRKVCEISTQNGININIEMLKNGYAVPFFIFITSDKHSKYKNIIQVAKDSKKGNWDRYYDVMECMYNLAIKNN